MNKIFSAFLVAAISSTCAFAQSTNIVGTGVENVIFTNRAYAGAVGQSAANISNLSSFASKGSSYSGGIGISGTSAAGIKTFGSAGLNLTNINTIVVGDSAGSAEQITGGNGGTIDNTIAGVAANGSGGKGVNFIATGSFVQQLSVDNAVVSGGHGGTVNVTSTGTDSSANGGDAVYASGAKFSLGKVTLNGGNGGQITQSSANSATARGGNGALVEGTSSVVGVFTSSVNATGGNGGTVNNTAGPSDAAAGDGISITSLSSPADLVVTGGKYQGGTGGISTAVSASGSAVAFGGNGLKYAGKSARDTKAVITGGTFIGGDGGTANNKSGSVSANGGAGAYIIFANTYVGDGTFVGSNAGLGNGVAQSRGAGLWTQDSNLVITNGTFKGLGLLFSSVNIAAGSSAMILGGTFDDVEFRSAKINNVDIRGGTYKNMEFSGTAVNNATISGATFNDLVLTSTGTSTLSLSNSVVSSGKVTMSAGTANVNLWSDSHFKNTSVSNGTMNFNNHSFNLGSGSSFALKNSTAKANFNGGLKLQNGGSLNVGLGQVYAKNLVTSSGSEIRTELSTANKGLITGERLTFEEGTKWYITGSASDALNGITLATATIALTNKLATTDFSYQTAQWWTGISAITNSGLSLVAKIGNTPFDVGLGAEAGSGYEKAMQAMSVSATNGTAAFTKLTSMTEQQAQIATRDGFSRTTEMANTLIGAQSLFADQITDRTRGYLSGKNWGSSAFYAPNGAQGPSGIYADGLEAADNLPSWDVSQTLRDASDAAPGNYDAVKGWVDSLLPSSPTEGIKVPPSYQAWGRGYGQFIQQDASATDSGYDSSVIGGVVGLDKRFNNLLLGLGGGYAYSDVSGNTGNDGEADTIYGTAYAAVNSGVAYLDANVNYALNMVDTESSPVFGYKGEYDASTVSMYFGGGLGLAAFEGSKWPVLLSPEASLLTTYYNQEGYTESSTIAGFAPKSFDSYDQWSYLGSLGATLSLAKQFECSTLSMEFRPEIRAHWLHEFNADEEGPTYSQNQISNIPVLLQTREEDLVKLGTGVRFSEWYTDTLEFGLDVDGIFGGDYEAIVVSGSLLHRF